MPQNFQKAVDWMHKADKQGKIIQDDPTYLHIKKIEKNKDDEEMVTILMQADATNPIVQYALAYSYCNGRGVKRDYSKAIKLYTLSANQGYTDAQKNLSYLYFHGIGTKKNTRLGVKFLQKSAKKK